MTTGTEVESPLLCSKCNTHPRLRQRTVCERCKNAPHREQKNEHKRKRRQELRLALLVGYGGKCVMCGETDTDVLVLDHINDDGHEARRTQGNQRVYEDLHTRGFPPEVQILCANDNMRKERRRYGFGSTGKKRLGLVQAD